MEKKMVRVRRWSELKESKRRKRMSWGKDLKRGKERKGKERKGKERKGKTGQERKGKERKGPQSYLRINLNVQVEKWGCCSFCVPGKTKTKMEESRHKHSYLAAALLRRHWQWPKYFPAPSPTLISLQEICMSSANLISRWCLSSSKTCLLQQRGRTWTAPGKQSFVGTGRSPRTTCRRERQAAGYSFLHCLRRTGLVALPLIVWFQIM